MEDSIFRVPKCCAADEYLNDTLRICSKALFSTDLDMNIFESNETGLDPDISLERAEYKLIPYYQALMCKSNEVRSRTYGIIITVACFWLIDVFMFAYPLESGKTQLALDVIKAALGVVTFIGFVGNKYTRKELKKKFTNKKRINSEDCEGLNGIHTPTPDTQCEMDTFISNNHAQMTTFQNNR
ncbi:hypothetical protein D910_05913 [Dendroctonus ponderosae]|uniref:Uncharacterized protein n=1 Tax=Dendroctonus ponderosae TaxID=77166 RepID=U4U629_DENPD|nr:hypothetical protein D910_05913 [Dendroctonus ponderosae]